MAERLTSLMPQPPDAATLARLTEAMAKMTPGPWDVTVEVDDEWNGQTVGTIAIAEISRALHDHDWAEPEDWPRDLANANAIVALVNAAPALVAGCETLLRVRAVLDKTPPKERAICPVWDAVTDALAALDAAREEDR